MKNTIKLAAILAIGVAAASETTALAQELQADNAMQSATPIFGAGLALPDITLLPGLALSGWTFKGSAGGMEADADGWRVFQMRTGSRDGDPVVNGRARFTQSGSRSSDSSEPDGTLHAPSAPAISAQWRVTPSSDVDLLETFVGGHIPGAVIGGGTAVVDGKSIPVFLDGAKPHLFRGSVSELSLVGRNGAEILRLAFAKPTRLLLQDGAHWGSDKLTIRIFFKEGKISSGTEYAIDAAISAPAAGPLALTDVRSIAIQAGTDWIPISEDPWIESGSALDFTKVLPHHAPAGKFGRVVAVGDHFEFTGLPGVPQRFYGVNICGDANVPSSREACDRFAAQLSRVGYNTLRIHHHERNLVSKTANRPAEDQSRGAGASSPAFNDTVPDPERIALFDNLVAACIEHGIYLTTDLFVSRSHLTTWRSLGIDRDGVISNTGEFKILCAFWEPAYSNLVAWSRNFMTHVNPHTGRSLAEEPALCTLALINEGNLGNWGPKILRDLPGVQEAWEAWLAGKRSEELRVTSDERKDADNSSLVTRHSSFDWDSIPVQIPDDIKASGDTPEGRQAGAFAMFLAEREAMLANRLRAFLREELNCDVPISSLSCWYNPVQYQMVRAQCFDYVDDHFYVDHPVFLEKSWSLPSSCGNANPMAGQAAGAKSVEWRRLMDKPFCLTEWNYSGPGRFRGVGGIATGALGALQNWSGMWRFAWSHGRSGVEKPETKAMGYFDMSGDPLGLAAERAALCLFLRGDLPVLPAEYPLVLDEASLLDPRTGAPACEVPAALWAGWHARVGSMVARGTGTSSAAPCAAISTSAAQAREDLAAIGADKPGNGAISIDSATGTFLIDTPRTAGGFAESGAHQAGPLKFEICGGSSPAAQPSDQSFANQSPVAATVWASSLDGKPIAESSRILVTHLTDVQNSGIRYGDPGLTILLKWGSLPHLMRNGSAEVELTLAGDDAPAPQDGSTPAWRVWRLAPSGKRLGTVPFNLAVYGEAQGGVSRSGDSSPRIARLRFTARTDYDPAAASYLYEVVRE